MKLNRIQQQDTRGERYGKNVSQYLKKCGKLEQTKK